MLEWAEELGVGLLIDEKVFDMACKEVLRWNEYANSPEFISVNVSRFSLGRKDFIECIQKVIDEHKVPYEKIGIEINGTDLGDELDEEWVNVTTQLKRLGFKIIIDDFVKSNFNIKTLIKHNIDIIKLDGSVVAEISNDTKMRNIADGVIKLSKSLNMKVVAEEVEQKEQLATLEGIDCDYYQGKLFCRPVNTVILEKILHS